MKKRLVLQDGIYGELLNLSRRFNGLEFAVTLFGSVQSDRFEVSHIAGPGVKSEHARGRCTNDHAYESDFFANLRKELPGIRYIGDLHAHPPSYPRFSGTDYRTIRQVLFGTDDTLHPEEYVAGIILPLRRIGEPGIAILPMYFTKLNPRGSEMELEYVHAGVCTKPDRARKIFLAAYRHGRGWVDREHALRHPRTYWRRVFNRH